ncbi:hypothetical protein L226DRAFT_139813 [Lentinus tigrinus ALCF2SS1-7]|uniref:Distal membrane-arm assembly complex protein 1-like domain-containing protein n=1 Tax=Lentinus tigrinus ALCF2SS1-6 TaxID=1328759 RepID=A0A5C2S498_9APHY|nr:hypothetical protein L227DRAFT_194063 [Lentinus tigrinus ALCF2SS1-6]RPD72854.1 hypothetical protein L226DRAFT_139813 [Lentinus tigrinus ALCF2SS1-7]
MSSSPEERAPNREQNELSTTPQDCLACRVIGTTALGGVGVYALNMSRAHAPGSVVGKRIMAGVGVGFLIASVLRWNK